MTTAAELQTVVTVPARFRGPEGSANGGWIAGTVSEASHGARHDSAVEVTLHAPTPLETELSLRHLANSATLTHGDTLLVEAIPVAEQLTAPAFVPFNEAARAEGGFAGLTGHAFPGCFTCGLRTPGDGLRIFPGPVPGTDLVAAGWRVPMTVTDEDGVVPDAIIWAALDCATGWAHFTPGEFALLGRLTAQVNRRVYPGGTYSVVARATGREGRKLFGESAVYEVDGTLVAAAKAVWIAPA
ncbi:hotdog fold domain-containing protein [Streptosporangium sp. NPDC051023]|uniref:hotdog fold domain-containing protein n=1 Tax=Streptosporangium sp. NPDC051023 TaxID=3155410 RepID=UPI00344CCB71